MRGDRWRPGPSRRQARGMRTKGVVGAVAGEGPGLADRAVRSQGTGKEPPCRDASGSCGPESRAPAGDGQPRREFAFCSVCGFVFPTGILVRFPGLVAVSSPGNYAPFRRFPVSSLGSSDMIKMHVEPTPRAAAQWLGDRAKRPAAGA